MADNTVNVPPGELKVSPEAFRIWAEQYFQCRRDFKPPKDFSPVPYFLLCRAIELQLKSWLLETRTQEQVKKLVWHKLIDAYSALPAEKQTLTKDEVAVLAQVSPLYDDKAFEYFPIGHAMNGYKDFPDLGALDSIADKLLHSA